jgi:hypothetical protein
MIDPIVDEVRQHRAEHARRFNFDLHAICADIQKMEATCGHTVVSLPPRMSYAAIEQLEPANQRRQHTIRAGLL